MSRGGNIYELRRWMYNFKDAAGTVLREYVEGVENFLGQAVQTPGTMESGKMFCPCRTCKNNNFIVPSKVWNHLCTRGFTKNYYVWYQHGEGFGDEIASTSSYHVPTHDTGHHDDLYGLDQNLGDDQHMTEMVTDAFRETASENVGEEPNVDAKGFYDMLSNASQPIYDRCRGGQSRLSLAARMMNIKTDYNLSESCMNAWAELIKEYLPEENVAASSFYEIQKLVCSLGLPFEVIDVCVDNCMIFWRENNLLEACKFCKKPRFKPQGSCRTRVPFQKMWYLPITDRLKRLYLSKRTAESMRWHGVHTQKNGEVAHPSDATAWKHFQSMHSDFAREIRNVYLGLCTDGFSPFGVSGRQYSLWPVILTPYNLPPDMCMRREFLFLTILVPGPKHPKRSLDVFLQPLIHELNQLWHSGVRTYDYSMKQNFTMRAVLMWTISDFPAYGMLSGWTTHGRLSCPYCMDRTDAFQLKHGRKTCWFDCHRRFLPINHSYRRNKKLFRKNRAVRTPPPVYMSGEDIEKQIDYYGAMETCRFGGNWHNIPANMPHGYLKEHNWHKKSIFWELPYWKHHLLRHNLDVMHIEKNFFDNIMNTLLNVKGKTKDNLKTRLDLPDICSRAHLHLLNEKAPVPSFRVQGEAKTALFNWVANDIKFPDGYSSNLSRCIEQGYKFSGMKSHDCHVFMQRLLPFAFAELLPENVNDALAGIGAFFRDLSTRTLAEEVIQQLDINIPILLCNLEVIFPPSFFDVMEHLVVHLPHEARLGGPVQFRWMYPFERFMKHLKGKAKNLAKVEGSIVAGSIVEETTHFMSYYFAPDVRTKKRAPRRFDDGGIGTSYPFEGVPDMFSHIGRLGGKLKEACWSSEQELHSAHTYILLNCEAVQPFESMFTNLVQEAYPHLTNAQIAKLKDRDFAMWLRSEIRQTINVQGRTSIPNWFEELCEGPLAKVNVARMYCSGGYVFQSYEETSQRTTYNCGVHVKGDIDFYGVLKEIIEVQYPGLLNLRCVLFKCDWFDPTLGRGVRVSKYGVVDVNDSRRFNKFEPFILASQAQQVSFVRYPRIRTTGVPWLAVVNVAPRGRIVGDEDDDPPMQQTTCNETSAITEQEEETRVVLLNQNRVVEDLDDETDVDRSEDEFGLTDDISEAEEEDDEDEDEDDIV